MTKTTVLIVDDSALIRALFTEILSGESDIEVVGTAADPFEAREKIKALNPKVVTLDIEMPKMDGISFLEKIMTLRPMPVVMASTLTLKGADITLRALELGAVDYVSKPTNSAMGEGLERLKIDLVAKVRAAAQANLGSRMGDRAAQSSGPIPFRAPADMKTKLVAIGSSTGGVEALRDVFIRLPDNLPPIVMVQHMPETFTPSFAARLNNLSQVTVHEASNGMKLEKGHAYLGPGGQQMKIVRRGNDMICRIDGTDTVSGHCPSVDVLFHSVAEIAGPDAVGIILTGMGRDGAQGLLKMHEAGAPTIGQDKASCIVYGMPRAAAEIGAVDIEKPLSQIAQELITTLERRRGAPHAS